MYVSGLNLEISDIPPAASLSYLQYIQQLPDTESQLNQSWWHNKNYLDENWAAKVYRPGNDLFLSTIFP